ncbi:MAG: glutaredoxin [Alphaproteobacteria bacterium]|nr:MAG: glutaredoxin [Alphaproteobacteria bacterium]
MKTPLLELYYFDSCPYCQRVLNVIHDLNIKVEYKDIHENLNDMQKLLYITGRKTVPCLFIDGVPMHESLDIMNWLKSNLDKLEKEKS